MTIVFFESLPPEKSHTVFPYLVPAPQFSRGSLIVLIIAGSPFKKPWLEKRVNRMRNFAAMKPRPTFEFYRSCLSQSPVDLRLWLVGAMMYTPQQSERAALNAGKNSPFLEVALRPLPLASSTPQASRSPELSDTRPFLCSKELCSLPGPFPLSYRVILATLIHRPN